MTDNQEKQLFKTLETMVSGMQIIQTDVKDIKVTLDKHSQILDEHSEILDKHSHILDKHSHILERLDAKTDPIAEKVIDQESRITTVEKDVADLRGGVH